MLAEKRVLLTDTGMRDAHSIVAGDALQNARPRVDSAVLCGAAAAVVFGGMLGRRDLRRGHALSERRSLGAPCGVPRGHANLLLQMLFRSANAVGYTNYPDKRGTAFSFARQRKRRGIDVFRVFDCLNWTDNMRVAIEAVRGTGRLCEAAICYTGNLSNPRETKYDLKYYVKIAKELQAMGAHVIAIKDMAGLCQPRAASALVKALKDEVGLPIHFHTHDTSGIAGERARGRRSGRRCGSTAPSTLCPGLTSQPEFGIDRRSAALRAARFASGSRKSCVRSRCIGNRCGAAYIAFESDIRAGASEVYVAWHAGRPVYESARTGAGLGLDELRGRKWRMPTCK